MADVDRGVSTILGYTLNLGVATLLVTGLLVSAGGYVENQQERAIRSELDVIGARTAGEIGAVDRLARSGPEAEISVTVSVPRRATGATYTIGVNESGNDRVVLETTNPDVSVSVPFRSELPVEAGSVNGGSFAVRYDETVNALVIDDE